MRKVLICVTFTLLIAGLVHAQKSKIGPGTKKVVAKPDLVNTRWKVFTSGDKVKWDGGWELILLSGGKVSQKWVDGSVENRQADYPRVSWKVSGNRLTYICESNCEERWTVTINGNSGQGRGSMGWKEIPLFVRVKKVN